MAGAPGETSADRAPKGGEYMGKAPRRVSGEPAKTREDIMDDANAMTDEQLKEFIGQSKGGRGDGSPASKLFDHWQCETCQTDAMERDAMFAHLRNVHGIIVEATIASMHITMHLDRRDFYQTNYAISLLDGRVNLSRFIRNERDDDDPMRWA